MVLSDSDSKRKVEEMTEETIAGQEFIVRENSDATDCECFNPKNPTCGDCEYWHAGHCMPPVPPWSDADLDGYCHESADASECPCFKDREK